MNNVKIAEKHSKPTVKPCKAPAGFDAKQHGRLQHYMECNGMKVGLNMPPGLADDGGMHGLPPYRQRAAFLVDAYPGCPESWVPSRGKMKSFFVPVEEGAGMWLDFNPCQSHRHHVAVVVSVQGVNAVTGLMSSDEKLEQYIEKCPKHDIAFGPDRLCEKCGFKWPKQNYLCTTAAPHGEFWLDGFRAADGVVRQYLLTAEKMRGVASNIIGEERVFAIGLAFFLSKDPKPEPTRVLRSRGLSGAGGQSLGWLGGNVLKSAKPDMDHHAYYTSSSSSTKGLNSPYGADTLGEAVMCSCTDMDCFAPAEAPGACAAELDRSVEEPVFMAKTGKVRAKALEVGAGARIRQQVHDDPNGLDFWQDEATGIICVNYVIEADARDIIERGILDLSGSPEGFLQGVPVGN